MRKVEEHEAAHPQSICSAVIASNLLITDEMMVRLLPLPCLVLSFPLLTLLSLSQRAGRSSLKGNDEPSGPQ